MMWPLGRRGWSPSQIPNLGVIPAGPDLAGRQTWSCREWRGPRAGYATFWPRSATATPFHPARTGPAVARSRSPSIALVGPRTASFVPVQSEYFALEGPRGGCWTPCRWLQRGAQPEVDGCRDASDDARQPHPPGPGTSSPRSAGTSRSSCFETVIPRNVRVGEAPELRQAGHPLTTPHCAGADAYFEAWPRRSPPVAESRCGNA